MSPGQMPRLRTHRLQDWERRASSAEVMRCEPRQRNRVAAIGQGYEPANHANTSRRNDGFAAVVSLRRQPDVFVLFICVNWRDSRAAKILWTVQHHSRDT